VVGRSGERCADEPWTITQEMVGPRLRGEPIRVVNRTDRVVRIWSYFPESGEKQRPFGFSLEPGGHLEIPQHRCLAGLMAVAEDGTTIAELAERICRDDPAWEVTVEG
jgi:hypothetical protein